MPAENRPSYIGFDGRAHQTLVSSPTTIIADETGPCKVQNTRIYKRAPVESHYRSRDQRCRVVDVTQPSVRLSNDAVDVHHRVTWGMVAEMPRKAPLFNIFPFPSVERCDGSPERFAIFPKAYDNLQALGFDTPRDSLTHPTLAGLAYRNLKYRGELNLRRRAYRGSLL